MKLYLDASAISDFDKCREFYRKLHTPQSYLGVDYPHGLAPVTPSIHYVFGTGAHTFVEAFWRGIQSQTTLTDIWYLVCDGGPCLCRKSGGLSGKGGIPGNDGESSGLGLTRQDARSGSEGSSSSHGCGGGSPDCFICKGTGRVEGYPSDLLNPEKLKKWEAMKKGIADMVRVYIEGVYYEPEKVLMVEHEWSYPYGSGNKAGASNNSNSGHVGSGHADRNTDQVEVILCGRIDRVMKGPRLIDLKTASEIGGKEWKANYREGKLLEFQFGLYDWILQRTCQCGHPYYRHDEEGTHRQCWEGECSCNDFDSLAPKEIILEVLIKPYPCRTHAATGVKEGCDQKPACKYARLERIDLNPVITDLWRKRFEQQLAFKVHEIARFHRVYREQRPWPLNASACIDKYGKCEMIDLCMNGESEKTMGKFVPKVPHLDLVRLG